MALKGELFGTVDVNKGGYQNPSSYLRIKLRSKGLHNKSPAPGEICFRSLYCRPPLVGSLPLY